MPKVLSEEPPAGVSPARKIRKVLVTAEEQEETTRKKKLIENRGDSLESSLSFERVSDPLYEPDFNEWKAWKKEKDAKDLTFSEGVQLAGEAFKMLKKELGEGAAGAWDVGTSGDLEAMYQTTMESLARGTADMGIIGRKIKNKHDDTIRHQNLRNFAIRSGMDAKQAKEFTDQYDETEGLDEYRRFITVRRLEKMRELARQGRHNLLDKYLSEKYKDFKKVNSAAAEGGSYVMDLSTVVGAAGPLTKLTQKSVGKAAQLVGKGAEIAGEGVRYGTEKIRQGVNNVIDSATGFDQWATGRSPNVLNVGVNSLAGTANFAGQSVKTAGSLLDETGKGIGRSPSQVGVMEGISKSATIPSGIRAAARFARPLDPVIDRAGSVGRGALEGAGVGATLGGAAEGEEGFYSGLGVGTPLGAGGAFLGRTILDLTGQSQKLKEAGDIAQEREIQVNNGLAPEKWDALGQETQARITAAHIVLGGRADIRVQDGATFQRGTRNKGAGAYYDPEKKQIVVNADSPQVSQNFLHELGEALWDSPVINKVDLRVQLQKLYGPEGLDQLGRTYARRSLEGKLTERAKQQNKAITEADLKRIRESITDEQIKTEFDNLYPNDPDWITREVFAETFMDLSIRDNLLKMRKRGGIKKPLDPLRRPLLVAKQRLLHGLGVKLDSLGRIQDKNNLFQTTLKTEPKLRRSVETYLRDLDRYIGDSTSAAKQKTKVRLKDLAEHPAAGWREGPEGPETDFARLKGGKVVMKDAKTIRDTFRNRSKEIKETISDTPVAEDDSTVGVRINPTNGRKEITGKVLPQEIKDLNSLTFSREAIDKVEEAINSDSVLEGWYQAIGTGDDWRGSVRNNLGNIPVGFYRFKPYEWMINKKGNINLRLINMDKLHAKTQKWLEQGKLGTWGNDVDSFASDMNHYLTNHREGRKGGDGLSNQKKNVLNSFFEARNDDVNSITRSMNRGNRRGDSIYETFRVDRLQDVNPSGDKMFFDYGPVKENFTPRRNLTHRRQDENIPTGHVIQFADPERNTHYGPHVWELVDDLPNVSEEIVKYAQDYYGVSKQEAEKLVNPDDIVSDAGAWDDPQFVSDLYHLSGIPESDLTGFRTNDGAVVLDRESVKFNKLNSDIRFTPIREPKGKSVTAKDISDWVKSHGVNDLEKWIKSTNLISTSKMLDIIGDFPGYLNPVVDHIVKQRVKLDNGLITVRDVAKAYAITIGSIGADAIQVPHLQKTASRLGLPEIDELFFSGEFSNSGNPKIRPEEAVAWWMGTPVGQRALNDLDAGVVNHSAWNNLIEFRNAYGRNDMRSDESRSGITGNPKKGFNLSNIRDLVGEINSAKGDLKKLEKTLMNVKGIGEGKKGFIGHLLGVGEWPTIDAVEGNVWLTGEGNTRHSSNKAKKRAALGKAVQSNSRLGKVFYTRILNRINELNDTLPDRVKIPSEAAAHTIHHWIWDSAKGVKTTHAGMYESMSKYSPVRTSELIDDASVPTLKLKDLKGKKIFPLKADLTTAGVVYKGIDSSEIAIPVDMQGGPRFPLLKSNYGKVAWANQGLGLKKRKTDLIKDADLMVVTAMASDTHMSNADVSSAIFQTVEAYIRDGKIDKKATDKLSDQLRKKVYTVKKGKTKQKVKLFEDFPGFNDIAKFHDYIDKDNLSFNKRAKLVEILSQASFRKAGFPSIKRILDQSRDPKYHGVDIGNALLVLKPNKKDPFVHLGEEGTLPHGSFTYGIKGEVVGVLEKPIRFETLWPEHSKSQGSSAYYALDRALPVEKITSETIKQSGVDRYQHIKSPKHARAILNAAAGNWKTSRDLVKDGGVSAADFHYALMDNDYSKALTVYSQKELTHGVRSGEMSLYQLNDAQIYFALKRGTPWHKDIVPGVGDAEVELVSVMNNEPGASGAASPAIMLKAIEEGATILDAYAVKSEKFPNGFLPSLYESYGFETIGTIPFDPSYMSKTELADLKFLWERDGWDRNSAPPDIVVMRYTGDESSRSTIRRSYLQPGPEGLGGGILGESERRGPYSSSKSNRKNLGQRGRGGSDRQTSGGGQGTLREGDVGGFFSRNRTRFTDALKETLNLGQADLHNLQIDPSLLKSFRNQFPTLNYSPVRFDESVPLNQYGGMKWTSQTGYTAIRRSDRAGIKLFDPNGIRLKGLFPGLEEAEERANMHLK